MYCQKLSAILGLDLTKECEGFIEDLKEGRHMKDMKRQKEKFERLWHRKQHSGNFDKSGHSNQVLKSSVQNTSVWWVINLSNPLLDTQKALLAHRLNFAANLKTSPYKEYITAIEVACQSLPPLMQKT